MSAKSLWSSARRSGKDGASPADKRTPFEHDYDRLLFSTPVRRLADKTQVFPLDRNDSVRTRLTHSHEVSNLARSLGNRLIRTKADCFSDVKSENDAAPVILAAVGLAHDLGNPPFGHQGEIAIRTWFEEHVEEIEQSAVGINSREAMPVTKAQARDFQMFEGNAQTLRLLTRLQSVVGLYGLDLTAATLAALMKYTVPSSKTDKGRAATKKFGFFASEEDVVAWIREKTGLEEGQRHPLTWLMEACDDTAYSVLDVEDAIKKGLASPEDLRAVLSSKFGKRPEAKLLLKRLREDFQKANLDSDEPTRIEEIKTSYLRTRLVETILTGAASEFLATKRAIFGYRRSNPLLECDSFASSLVRVLKKFARDHAYTHPSVLKVELQGALAIQQLMNLMWEAITRRDKFDDLSSRRLGPRASYVYSLISSSYRWHFEQASSASVLSIRYREMQLLTDMVSGMTDRFAVELHDELQQALDG